ncbi:MAG: PleD family two-component system response regulator [Candidatus Dormibacteria bacterium]
MAATFEERITSSDGFGPVVIADDDPAMRLMLAHTLQADGFDVFEAEDGFQALSALRRLSAAALVTDVVMPRMNGLQLVTGIRQLHRMMDLPVVVTTGLPPDDARIKARRRFDRLHILFKPFSPAALRCHLDVLTDSTGAESVATPPAIAGSATDAFA